MPEASDRIVWLDWLRVCACLMVMTVHATEPFYLGGEGSHILTASDAVWVSFFDSLVRACVPLFVITSSYLLFPLTSSTGAFFRRRASRLLVPFVIWSLAYALAWGEPVENLRSLLLNFNYVAGHLWFVYMLVGLYLLMPLLSPWASRVGRRELEAYLAVWCLTLLIPFVREWASGGEMLMIEGPTGIPSPAAYPLWGEASWNGYGTFYYVSGFIGYLLLGLYFRRFVPALTWRRTLAIGLPLWLIGFFICFGGFLVRVWASVDSFPFDAPLEYAVAWELPLFNDTLGVALMAVGWLLLFRQKKDSRPKNVPAVAAVSRASYGMYLCHMFVLATASAALRSWLGTGAEGLLGIWTTPVEIILTALATFCITTLVCVPLQRVPRVGKWLVG
ncbi:MAG: acyltransferase [Bacteroidaceae bacterium]|nr:acyltransferase [Bacteroidaceae bacterium]